MFIGRERELATLEKFYSKEGLGMIVIYGRRRIGKSTLITEFIRNKKAIHYTATKVGAKRNLELFKDSVLSVLAPNVTDMSFNSIEGVFDYIAANIKDENTVLVIDELPYWATSDLSLLSIIQKYMENGWKELNLKIILCGSSLSFMQDKVLSEKSPIFGRRDSQIKLEAFNYLDAAKFIPNYSCEDKATVYGITGGVAKYLSMIDANKSVDENIKNLYFSPDGYLYDEPRNLLAQEFTEVQTINNIIHAIATGENTISDISSKTNEQPSTVFYALERLINTGLVEKKRCITEPNNKKKIQYVLKDHMLQFWYKYVEKATSLIEIGHGHIYFDKIVKADMHSYMGPIFENICKQFVLLNSVNDYFNNFITEVGCWWGREPVNDTNGKKAWQSTDIDIVATSSVSKKTLVGECKFKNEKIDRSVYEVLKRRASLIASEDNISDYVLFSLSGFSDYFSAIKDEKLTLVSLDEMY